MVGFGPGSGTSIAGGTYFNVDADSFNAHGVDRVVTLAANQTGPGLFPASTLVFPNEFTNPNFDVVVCQVNGKFVLFGFSNFQSNPYELLLVQQ